MLRGFASAAVAAAVLFALPNAARAQDDPDQDPADWEYVQGARAQNGNINHGVLRRQCGYPPYARSFSGGEVVGNAQITADALNEETRRVLQRIAAKAQTGEPGSNMIGIQGRLWVSREVVGGYAHAAFEDVGQNYFCRLVAAYGDDPDRRDALDAAWAYYNYALLQIFNPAIYQSNEAAINARERLIERLEERAEALPRAFTLPQVSGSGRRAALERFSYSGAVNFGAAATVVIAEVATGTVCASADYRSLVVVDTRVLHGLDPLRSLIGNLLTGNGSLTNSRLMGLAQDLYGTDSSAISNRINDQVSACVRNVAQAVHQAAADAEENPALGGDLPEGEGSQQAPTGGATAPAPAQNPPTPAQPTPNPSPGQ